MKKLIYLLSILFLPFKGSIDNNIFEDNIPQDEAEKVLSGMDAIIKQGGDTVGFATGVNIDEDFALQGIKTLGHHGDRGFKSTDYNCRMTIDSFILQGTVAKTLNLPTRENVLNFPPFDFDLIDATTGSTLLTVSGAKCSTKAWSMNAGQLSAKNTTWLGRQVKEKNVS
jgi:hypothetical protein